MVGKTNVAGAKLFAAIGVTYPAGSTLTCTNGTSTLKAKTTSGQWVFAIPEAGTWTVTAADGTNTKSQSVEITTEGQSVSVTLNYALELITESGILAGYETDNLANGIVTVNTNSVYLGYTGSAARHAYFWYPSIDVTNYSTLYATVNMEKAGSSGEGLFFCIADENTQPTEENAIAYTTLNSTGTHTIEVSIQDITGEKAVGFHASHSNSTITHFWLE